MPKKSFKFDLSADITRDQHVRMTCGKTAGPRSWKTEDKRRTERAELSRKLRDALDQVGLSDRRSLAHQFDNFVELINAAVRTKKGFSRTEVAAMMEWHKSMHQVGELLHDESVHVSHIIRVSTDLLKTANLHDEYQSGVDLMFFWPPSLSLESFNQLTGWLKSVRSLEYGSIEQKPSDDVPIIFGLVTNSQKSVERQRETRALPDVAERKRRPIINTVEHYLKCLAPAWGSLRI